MKKLTIATVILGSVIAFTHCKKANETQLTHKQPTLADMVIAQRASFMPEYFALDRANLGQADGGIN